MYTKANSDRHVFGNISKHAGLRVMIVESKRLTNDRCIVIWMLYLARYWMNLAHHICKLQAILGHERL